MLKKEHFIGSRISRKLDAIRDYVPVKLYSNDKVEGKGLLGFFSADVDPSRYNDVWVYSQNPKGKDYDDVLKSSAYQDPDELFAETPADRRNSSYYKKMFESILGDRVNYQFLEYNNVHPNTPEFSPITDCAYFACVSGTIASPSKFTKWMKIMHTINSTNLAFNREVNKTKVVRHRYQFVVPYLIDVIEMNEKVYLTFFVTRVMSTLQENKFLTEERLRSVSDVLLANPSFQIPTTELTIHLDGLIREYQNQYLIKANRLKKKNYETLEKACYEAYNNLMKHIKNQKLMNSPTGMLYFPFPNWIHVLLHDILLTFGKRYPSTMQRMNDFFEALFVIHMSGITIQAPLTDRNVAFTNRLDEKGEAYDKFWFMIFPDHRAVTIDKASQWKFSSQVDVPGVRGLVEYRYIAYMFHNWKKLIKNNNKQQIALGLEMLYDLEHDQHVYLQPQLRRNAFLYDFLLFDDKNLYCNYLYYREVRSAYHRFFRLLYVSFIIRNPIFTYINDQITQMSFASSLYQQIDDQVDNTKKMVFNQSVPKQNDEQQRALIYLRVP